MNEDLRRIRRYITTLIWRERGLVLGRVVLQGGLVACGVVALATIAAAWRWDRPTATAVVVLAFGIGVWAAVALPLLGRWRATGDAVRQARLVEGLAPELRGRLLTAVDRVEGPRGAESPAMLGLVARRAAAAVAGVSPARVHSARHLAGIAAATAFAWLVSTVLLLAVPGGPVGTARWWASGGVARAAAELATRGEEADTARVGDHVLRYVYPAYTGLEPREITNGTGDAHGPPGTIVEVTARSADPIEAASLVAYDDPALEARVGEDGRRVQGAFGIRAEEGVWRILTHVGGEAVPSRDFKIVPEIDLPPEVQVDAASVIEVAVDERIGLTWRARDDFGIQKVVVEVEGKEVGSPLLAPRERKSEVSGDAAPRPADLGLKAGDRVRLTIAAWDNDAVSGSKRGSSREIEVVVLGASGLDMKEDDRQRELRKLLVLLLADFLEEPFPPGRTAGSYATWGEAVAGRYAPLDAWVEAAWGERMPRDPRETIEFETLIEVTAAGRKLVRYTQVGFMPGSPAAPKAADVEIVGGLREGAVLTTENAILLLDQMIQARAYEAVVEAAQRVGDLAVDVQLALQSGEMTAQEMLTRLAQLDVAMQKLMEASARLEDGSGMREFVNSRSSELGALSEEIRKALAEGRTEEAQELMARLARQMEQLAQGVQDEIERQQQNQRDIGEEASELVDELEALEKEQRQLQERTRELREQSDAQAAEEAEDGWERAQKKAEEHAAAAERYVQDLERAGRPFNERTRAEGGQEMSERLRDAIVARDLRGAQWSLEEAYQAWESVGIMYDFQRRASGAEPSGPGRSELEAMGRQLDEIAALLEQLQESSDQVDPKTQQQVREMREQQRELEERLQEAQGQAQKIGQSMRPPPQGMSESLEQAEQAMEQAGEDLGQGQPMPAEGQQGAAADRIREARERLEKAISDAQAMAQEGKGKGGEPGEGEEGGSRAGNGRAGPDRVELPNPEQFKTPEQYRQELLEGMEGDVPEEYRALKKRYYEELVHQ